MMVFLRPTGSPLGQTLGLGPNGSPASLDTAPANTALLPGDILLIQSGGQLCTLPPSALPPPPLTVAGLTAVVATLPTALPAAAGELWLDNGVLTIS